MAYGDKNNTNPNSNNELTSSANSNVRNVNNAQSKSVNNSLNVQNRSNRRNSNNDAINDSRKKNKSWVKFLIMGIIFLLLGLAAITLFGVLAPGLSTAALFAGKLPAVMLPIFGGFLALGGGGMIAMSVSERNAVNHNATLNVDRTNKTEQLQKSLVSNNNNRNSFVNNNRNYNDQSRVNIPISQLNGNRFAPQSSTYEGRMNYNQNSRVVGYPNQGSFYQMPMNQGGFYPMPMNQGGSNRVPVYQGGSNRVPMYQGGFYRVPMYQGGFYPMPIIQGGSNRVPMNQGGFYQMPTNQGGSRQGSHIGRSNFSQNFQPVNYSRRNYQ